MQVTITTTENRMVGLSETRAWLVVNSSLGKRSELSGEKMMPSADRKASSNSPLFFLFCFIALRLPI
jgi:hypothetical protein